MAGELNTIPKKLHDVYILFFLNNKKLIYLDQKMKFI